ncbi:MAG TPA: radical SAM-modified peptide, FtsH ternary system-associated [Ktedonobacterales bacterium]|nr:radical SAM-modified peptide, FtsH ternary system-associated [Ktedonobacterales bacterium]
MAEQPASSYVDHIPDLMTWDDYEVAHERKVIRFRLTLTDQGLEIIGDSPYPHLLEQILSKLDPVVIEMMLCG